jgi:hypothetical protein
MHSAESDKTGRIVRQHSVRTSRHDDGLDGKLFVRKHALECLSLALAAPDAKNEGHLDLGQVHEVLRYVHRHLHSNRF